MERSLILLPDFENQTHIERIRRCFDPLATKIPAHLTLVFPFESSLTNQAVIRTIEASIASINSFPLRLKGITGDAQSGYLFLNVKQGNDQIIQLHDLLYQALFPDKMARDIIYTPHLTVGRLSNKDLFYQALDDLVNFKTEFKTVIDKFYLEEIQADETSKIIHSFILN